MPGGGPSQPVLPNLPHQPDPEQSAEAPKWPGRDREWAAGKTEATVEYDLPKQGTLMGGNKCKLQKGVTAGSAEDQDRGKRARPKWFRTQTPDPSL